MKLIQNMTIEELEKALHNSSETIIKYESERLVIESQLNTEYLVNKRLERQITYLKTCPECSRVNEKAGYCEHCRGDV